MTSFVSATSIQAAEGVTVTSRFRALIVLAACIIAAGTFAATAAAVTHVYFGYNNLTASNPSQPNCNGIFSFFSGYACFGKNYNDYTQVDWTSGRSDFRLGFTTCYGCGYENRLISGNENFGTYTVRWSQFPVSHYNYSVCSHSEGGPGSYNYLQCRALVF